MKKIVYILTALLFFTFLTGCACQHEWTQPDCQNPAVCTKCQETGAEALGHDWADATCTAPQTCLRCSETKGDPLMHSYGDWNFHKDDEQMSHACSTCGYVDYLPIERRLYLESLLTGRWDIWGVDVAEGSYLDAWSILSAEEDLNSYIIFGDDRRCQITMNLFVGKPTLIGSWEYDSYSTDETGEIYKFSCYYQEYSNKKRVALSLRITPEGERIIEFAGKDSVVYFYQEEQRYFDAFCGNWGVTDDKIYYDDSYYFTFHPDRTVSFCLEGIFEGTWTLYRTHDYPNSIEVLIQYERNGEYATCNAALLLDEISSSERILYLYGANTNYTFQQISQSEVDTIHNATSSLSGTWRSMGDSPNPELADEINNAYTITFLENGTFELQHENGRTYTGRWSVFNCQKNYYQYHLYLDKQNITFQCILYAYDDYNSHFLYLDDNMGNEYQGLYFLRDLQDIFSWL